MSTHFEVLGPLKNEERYYCRSRLLPKIQFTGLIAEQA